MAGTSQTEGAAEPRRPEGRIERSWHLLVDGLAVVGTILIGVLMVIICADIVARNSMGASLPLVSELGALLLVMIVALQLAATVRVNRLARAEFFFAPFCSRFPRAGLLLGAAFDLAAMSMLGLIAWGTVRVLEKDYNSAEFIGVTGIATLPTWPFRVLVLLGFAVAAAEFLVRIISALRQAIGAKP